MTHGGPDAEVRHVGDLGNVHADVTGTVTVYFHKISRSLLGENFASLDETTKMRYTEYVQPGFLIFQF